MNEQFETVQKICPQCGKAIDADAIFCKYCAFNLAGSEAGQNFSTEINQSPAKNNTLIISSIIGLLIVGLVGLVIFLNTGKNNQPVAENTNSISQASASTLTLGEKAQQIEQKILRGEALSASDIEGLSATELRILRNAQFARYGRKYERPGLGDYFYTRPWYKPNDNFKDSMISATDKDNINLIVATENMGKNSEIASTNSNTLMNTSVVTNTDNQTVSAPQSINDLNRQTVLSLIGDKMDRTVTASLPVNSFQHSDNTPEYGQMIEEKIISCEWAVNRWKNCVVGPKGPAFTKGWNYGDVLLLNIGKVSPTNVSGISRSNETSAVADVVLSFEGNNNYELYNRHSNAFDDEVFYESNNSGFYNGYSHSSFRPNQVQRIMLRLYDDGWRIEKGN